MKVSAKEARQPPPTAPADMARALAALFGSGGTLTLMSLLFPPWPGLNRSGLAAPAIVAEVTCVALLALAPRIRPRWLHAVLALGTACIGVAVHFGGEPGHVVYAAYYVWVALYGFYFFSTRAAWAHLGLAAGSYLGVLLSSSVTAAGPAMLVMLGTAAVTGIVIASLVRKVRELANVDPLTGLMNRRVWTEQLPVEVARAHRRRAPLSIVILDLDNLKLVNDRAGHDAGDRAIISVTRHWEAQTRKGDVLTRLGGDEFGLILPDCTGSQAATLLMRMRAGCPHHFSAGAAVLRPGESVDSVVARADAALYRAKRAGRDQIVAAEAASA